MKTVKKIGLTAFMALTLVLTSCSSDSSGGSSTSSAANYVNAKVDGASFATLEVQGQSTASCAKETIGTDTFIQMTGVSSTGSTIEIVLHNVTTTGTYTIDGSNDNVISYLDMNSQTSFNTTNSCSGATGTVVISALTDTKIEGTFNFTGKNEDNCSQSKSITAGSFRGTFAN